MISGILNSRLEAILRIRVTGPSGIELEIDAVLDTGFTGSLVLPSNTVASLELNKRSGGSATLADGSVRHFETYGAEVDWDGAARNVVVSAVGTEALIGMGMLKGYSLRLDVISGGAVEIAPLRD